MSSNRNDYDLHALMSLIELNAELALAYCSGREDFFKRLDNYVDDHKSYLRDYNPMVVVYSDDMRKEFIAEMDSIKNTLFPLMLTHVNNELDNLRSTLDNNDAKSFSDGLVKFYATLEITANKIISARIAADVPVIIAVDDMPTILSIIQGSLSHSYKVICCTNGKEALKAANSHKPSLFLLDIEMPEIDGFKLAEQIRNMDGLKDVPIIYLTSCATRDHVIMAKMLGAQDYLLKPLNSDALIKKIDSCLGM